MGANLEELAEGRIGKLLLKYSWPALVAMSLNALYAVVDRVFIGQGCGVDAMAGVQLAMPAMMLLTAFGPLIGVGHAALLSIKLGAGDTASSEKLVGEYWLRIPKAGNVAMFMQTTTGLLCCVVAPLVLLVLYDLLRRKKYEKSQKQDCKQHGQRRWLDGAQYRRSRGSARICAL